MDRVLGPSSGDLEATRHDRFHEFIFINIVDYLYASVCVCLSVRARACARGGGAEA